MFYMTVLRYLNRLRFANEAECTGALAVLNEQAARSGGEAKRYAENAIHDILPQTSLASDKAYNDNEAWCCGRLANQLGGKLVR